MKLKMEKLKYIVTVFSGGLKVTMNNTIITTCFMHPILDLTKLVNKLKKRISPLKAPMSLKLSKEPSQLLPPQDCPSWALSSEYNRYMELV